MNLFLFEFFQNFLWLFALEDGISNENALLLVLLQLPPTCLFPKPPEVSNYRPRLTNKKKIKEFNFTQRFKLKIGKLMKIKYNFPYFYKLNFE